MDNDITTIPIKKTTRDLLKRCGNKGETWDELLNKLMKVYNNTL